MKEKKLDIVVYGSTGFTGNLCVKYLKENYPDIKFAIGGRNKEKLRAVSDKYSLGCKIFVADGDDSKALDKITGETKVVLSTAGPFHRYGSKMVASCVKNNAHYVDITGENFWVRKMIAKHHEKAKQKGVRIVPACGYDSIPSDLGVFFSATSFGGPVRSIFSYHTMKGGASGGTIETMFAISDLKLERSSFGAFALNPKNSVTDIQKKFTSDKVSVEKNKTIKAWTGPFIMAMANTRVVRRGAALLAENNNGYGENFIYKESAYYSKKRSAYITSLMGFVIVTPLRKIVRPFLKQPGQGPSQKVMDGGFFKCKFVVTGENGSQKIYSMRGDGDPGYKVTSKFVCESALCLLGNHENLPGGSGYGGILTSSSGLGEVLINRLKNVGIVFE
jgi:short subunit dehydrogenase-like uncharacterized protein